MKTVKLRKWAYYAALYRIVPEAVQAGHECDAEMPNSELVMDRKTEKLLKHLRQREV